MQQRLIIEVCQGRFMGRKAVIAAGESLRVGRSDLADFVLPKDRTLSGVHFELSWDGSTCHLKDAASKGGTLLAGERVDTGPVAHGSWIRAGQTDFLVFYEAHTPRRWSDAEDEQSWRNAEWEVARQQALDMLQAEAAQARLYAVLDAARAPRVLQVVRESVEEYRSLYEGLEGEMLADAAPHLVSLPAGSRLLEQLVQEGWGQRWGLYVSSARRFKDVRRHLRRFLRVELEASASRVYFRYYDPRVMDVFWAASTVRQRRAIMAELRAMIFETRQASAPLRVEVAA